MRIYTKEYGWVRERFLDRWLRWLLLCSWLGHSKKMLRDGHRTREGWCNSDNCDQCTKCGIESHD